MRKKGYKKGQGNKINGLCLCRDLHTTQCTIVPDLNTDTNALFPTVEWVD